MAKTLWGVDGAEDEQQWDSIFARIASDGYNAIECCSIFTFGGTAEKGAAFQAAAAKHNLEIIVQIHTSGGYFDNGEYVYCGSYKLEDHLASVATEIDKALHAKPKLINCHGGVDAWAREIDPAMPVY